MFKMLENCFMQSVFLFQKAYTVFSIDRALARSFIVKRYPKGDATSLKQIGPLWFFSLVTAQPLAQVCGNVRRAARSGASNPRISPTVICGFKTISRVVWIARKNGEGSRKKAEYPAQKSGIKKKRSTYVQFASSVQPLWPVVSHNDLNFFLMWNYFPCLFSEIFKIQRSWY